MVGYSQNLLATLKTDTNLQARNLCYIYIETSEIDICPGTTSWRASISSFNLKSVLYIFFLDKLIISKKLSIDVYYVSDTKNYIQVIALVLFFTIELEEFKVL